MIQYGDGARLTLNDKQLERIDAVLEAERGAGRPQFNNRRFIEAVLWCRRTGVPWRDLPAEFGPWKAVFNRLDQWSATGRWR